MRQRIADKIFYGIISLLVLILGGLGSIIIYQRIQDQQKILDREVQATSTYLESALPGALLNLNAKKMRKIIEEVAARTLQVVEIFDEKGERIYVYERTDSQLSYDLKVDRNLYLEGKLVGKINIYFSLEDALHSLRFRELLRLVILISAAGLVLGLGLYRLVQRLVLKPIGEAVSFSEALTLGNYHHRIQVHAKDEMGLLQESLNQMADSLREAVDKLETSRLEALESSRLKSEFLANMSHEIRTPLHAILGFTDLLLEEESFPERRQSLETVRTSAQILLDNINDILDYSKLEAAKMTVLEESFSIDDLVSEIAPLVEMRLQGKSVSFQTEVVPVLKGSPIRGDRARIRQVLLNLLINAAKFTEKGQISLRVYPNDKGLETVFEIEDTGIGIPSDHHEKIFEPFIQVDSSMTRKFGGTGLGLAIARRIVEMMGGRLWLTSEPGRGSTFYFTTRSSA
ncbi:MAG: HAMP domain-containing protein [Deltaproteobacteria bacterium]|nr:HAMP domain-containing protein [Deltaproteobacteria bacterium]